MLIKSEDPILAICVPTFNRSHVLGHLLNSLSEVRKRFGSMVEICISNNASTDSTQSLLDEFLINNPVTVVVQDFNIGGTRNIISVALQMKAQWGILCGDDDIVSLDDLGRIIEYLRGLDPNTWVLNLNASKCIPTIELNIFCGRYTFIKSVFSLTRLGLDSLGFMGVHIFPRPALPVIQGLAVEEVRPWPHIAAFLKYMMNSQCSCKCISGEIVQQARGGISLFWSAGDLVSLHLLKFRILGALCSEHSRPRIVVLWLMISELFLPKKIKQLVAWKLCEPNDFGANAVAKYREAYREFRYLQVLTIPHYLFLMGVGLVNQKVFRHLVKLFNKYHVRAIYVESKRRYRKHSGMIRGI